VRCEGRGTAASWALMVGSRVRHDIDVCVSPSGAVVDGDSIEEVVVKLNAMYKAATLALAVGTLIIGTFYSGDLPAWRARGSKDCSFGKLARHPRLPMSPTALYRSVAIHELCERLGVREWKVISSTHLRRVLKLLPDPATSAAHHGRGKRLVGTAMISWPLGLRSSALNDRCRCRAATNAPPRPGRIAALACVALESMRLAGRPCSCSRRTLRRSPSMQHRQRSVANCQSVASGFVQARREYLPHLLTTTLFPLPISRPHANRSAVVPPRELHGTGFAEPSIRVKRMSARTLHIRVTTSRHVPHLHRLQNPYHAPHCIGACCVCRLHHRHGRLELASNTRAFVMAVCPSLRSSCEPRHLNIQSEEGSHDARFYSSHRASFAFRGL
jgi:hypothetical protein